MTGGEGGAPVRHVSTGALPGPERVAALVSESHARNRDVADGAPSAVYPALARADPALFGVCVVGVQGTAFEAGDVDVAFTVMSVSKPFVHALACEALGAERVRREIGANATGLPFNSLAAVERGPDGRTNPMVNAGALATTGLVPAATADERWDRIHEGLSRFAGRTLPMDDEVLASALATNHRNRALSRLLLERGRIAGDPDETVDVYTRQCSLGVTAHDLAVMGATLADGGVNPVTGERVVGAEACREALAAMATAGLYEDSGQWLADVGLPGKSGIGGGMLTVSPGKGALATFSPPLDAVGNSVRGTLVARFLSRELGLDLFASQPLGAPAPPV